MNEEKLWEKKSLSVVIQTKDTTSGLETAWAADQWGLR